MRVLVLTFTLVAVGLVPTATAQSCSDGSEVLGTCDEEDMVVAWVDGVPLEVNPDQADDYALAVAGWGVDVSMRHVLCLFNTPPIDWVAQCGLGSWNEPIPNPEDAGLITNGGHDYTGEPRGAYIDCQTLVTSEEHSRNMALYACHKVANDVEAYIEGGGWAGCFVDGVVCVDATGEPSVCSGEAETGTCDTIESGAGILLGAVGYGLELAGWATTDGVAYVTEDVPPFATCTVFTAPANWVAECTSPPLPPLPPTP